VIAAPSARGLGPPVIVVMGVSAAGKTSVGRALASRLGVPFRDADDLHPPANIAKMAAGTPLTDDDRWPWLDRVGQALAAAGTSTPSSSVATGDGTATGIVMACSALKRAYRDALRAHSAECVFVHLTAPRAVLESRIGSRSDHFMPSTLLDSQLDTLEPLVPGEAGVTIDVSPSVAEIVDEAVAALAPALR
jgi:gluconokinase